LVNDALKYVPSSLILLSYGTTLNPTLNDDSSFWKALAIFCLIKYGDLIYTP
jgi:hypothetical protein